MVLLNDQTPEWELVIGAPRGSIHGNKVKGRISKRVLQENEARHFPKNEYFLPPDAQT